MDKQISCDNYIDKIKELKKKKIELEKDLFNVDKEIKKTEKLGKHCWERKREEGLYGELYYVCKICGIT